MTSILAHINSKHGNLRAKTPLKITILILGFLILSACGGLSTEETDCTIDTMTVNIAEDIDDGACDAAHCSLREAIIAANTCTDFPAYQVHVPAGTYTLTIRGPEDDRGDLDLTRNMSITGASPETTIITGESTWIYRIFDIHSGINAIITNLTITGGDTTEPGGGISNRGILELSGITLANNHSSQIGGGLYNDGQATLVGVEVIANAANIAYRHGCGGGLYNAGTLRIDFSTISENNAYHGDGICNENGDLIMSDAAIRENGLGRTGLGGGIYSIGGLVHLENTILSNNTAEKGGGLFFADGPLEMLFSEIHSNIARFGGGLYLGQSANADLDLVKIYENGASIVQGRDGNYYAGEGGGVYTLTNNWDFYKSPITNNQALGNGGGMYIDADDSGQGYFSHSAIAYNRAPLSGVAGAEDTRPGGVGAAVYIKRGNILLSNATVSNNDGLGDGSVYFNSAEANTRFVHVTMADNNIGTATSSFTDPVQILNQSGGTITFLNSLIIGIRERICAGDEAGYHSEGGNIAVYDPTCRLSRTHRADDLSIRTIPSGGVILPLVELDGELIHLLAPGSDAIDFVTLSTCIRDDQRLTIRPLGALCDAGAFEWELSAYSEIDDPPAPGSDDKDDGDKAGGDDKDDDDKDDGKEDDDDNGDGEKKACEFTALVNLFCRTGPGSVYKEIDSFVPASFSAVLGISPDGYYVQVVGPNFGAGCYVPFGGKFGSLSGDCDDLTVLPVPSTPIPTATPVPTATPAPPTLTPTATPVPPTKVPPTKVPPTKVQPTPTCDQSVNCTNQP